MGSFTVNTKQIMVTRLKMVLRKLLWASAGRRFSVNDWPEYDLKFYRKWNNQSIFIWKAIFWVENLSVDAWYEFWKHLGTIHKGCSHIRGGQPNVDRPGQGEGGPKNSQISADILHGWSLITNKLIQELSGVL